MKRFGKQSRFSSVGSHSFQQRSLVFITQENEVTRIFFSYITSYISLHNRFVDMLIWLLSRQDSLAESFRMISLVIVMIISRSDLLLECAY